MKSWQEKLNDPKPSQVKKLEKDVLGKPAGTVMYISTPLEIDKYVRSIPAGKAITTTELREALAKKNKADFTCPLTTGIFLRIVAEAAFEGFNAGKKVSAMTPFWRVIEPTSNLAKKLSFDSSFIKKQRAKEGIANT